LDTRVIGKLVRTRGRPAAPGRRVQAGPDAHVSPGGALGTSRQLLPTSAVASSAEGFHVEQRVERGVTILAPVGEFDQAAVRPFEQALPAAVERARPIVVDLAKLSFIDSCGLWAVTQVCSACRRSGISLQLWAGAERIHEVFEVTGLCDLLPFVERPSWSAR
jgi:anti-sigma B factor antagonist